jgi:hypothetical protein
MEMKTEKLINNKEYKSYRWELDAGLYRQIKAQAALEGLTVKDFLIRLCVDYLTKID